MIRDANADDLYALLGAPGVEPLLSIKQVARTLGVHENTVRRYIAQGDLPAIRLGYGRGRVMVEPAALRRFLRRSPSAARVHNADTTVAP